MAIGLRPFVIGFAIVLLFYFYMLGFVVNFIGATNPDSELLGNKYMFNSSIGSIQRTMSDFTNTSQDVYGQLSTSQPSATDYLFLIFRGAFYIPLTFLAFVFSGISLLSSLLFNDITKNVGGYIAITTGIALLVSSLLVTIVLLIVRAVRTGESER